MRRRRFYSLQVPKTLSSAASKLKPVIANFLGFLSLSEIHRMTGQFIFRPCVHIYFSVCLSQSCPEGSSQQGLIIKRFAHSTLTCIFITGGLFLLPLLIGEGVFRGDQKNNPPVASHLYGRNSLCKLAVRLSSRLVVGVTADTEVQPSSIARMSFFDIAFKNLSS